MTHFQILANSVNKLFKRTELYLDFTGYNDFLESYKKINPSDAEGLNDLIRESLLWNDYISENINNFNILLYSYITESKALESKGTMREEFKIVKEKLVMLRLLIKELYIQKRHCLNIYYHCMKAYENSMKAFSINDYAEI